MERAEGGREVRERLRREGVERAEGGGGRKWWGTQGGREGYGGAEGRKRGGQKRRERRSDGGIRGWDGERKGGGRHMGR